MKKLLLVVISAVILATIFTGCEDPLKDGYKKATTSATSSTEETKAEEYENTYSGLKSYMVDKNYISDKDNGIEMNAELIGAKKGYLYKNGKISIELYEFKTKNNNKKAEAILTSVKEKGIFEIYETEIQAYLTADSKFMMIYNDSENNEEVKKQTIKDFEKFNK